MATATATATVEKYSFNHPNLDNRHIEVEFEMQDGKPVSAKCNVPEVGDLSRGDIQRTYDNLKAFLATLKK